MPARGERTRRRHTQPYPRRDDVQRSGSATARQSVMHLDKLFGPEPVHGEPAFTGRWAATGSLHPLAAFLPSRPPPSARRIHGSGSLGAHPDRGSAGCRLGAVVWRQEPPALQRSLPARRCAPSDTSGTFAQYGQALQRLDDAMNQSTNAIIHSATVRSPAEHSGHLGIFAHARPRTAAILR